MGSTTQGPFDPTSTTPVDTQLGNSTSGCILIHNLSQYELLVTTPDALMNSFVAAWGWRRFDVSDPMPKIKWSIVATPNQANPPLSAVFVESYELKSDAPPQYFGVYQRQTSVGNQVSVTQTTSLKNDGQAPATPIIESTPSDQAVSAFNLDNDGSGLWQVLSAGVQRVVAQIVRGNATSGKASITLGDTGDASIMTLNGLASFAKALVNADLVHGFTVSWDSGNSRVNLLTSVVGGATSVGSTYTYIDSGGTQRVGQIINSDGSGVLGANGAGLNYSAAGALTKVGSTAATGATGVPVVVARAYQVHVSAITNTTIVTYTTGAAGLYRISVYASIAGTGNGTSVTVHVAWTDAKHATALNPAGPAVAVVAPSGSTLELISATNVGNPSFVAGIPLLVDAANATQISVSFQDNGGTPSDDVSAIIEYMG